MISHIDKLAVAPKYEAVWKQIAETARKSGRDPREITLVGVTKMHPAETVVDGILSGIKHIGENKVQEAEEKIPLVKNYLQKLNFTDSVTWHMIGKLQSNKAAKAARLFDIIESVDRLKIAQKLSSTAHDEGKVLDVLIEVNTSGEEQKGGVDPADAVDLVSAISDLPNLRLQGLMTIGPLTEDTGKVAAAFALLRELLIDIRRQYPDKMTSGELSMGMSGDYRLAIREGSTMVRIGTALFGARKYN